jgi:hypothetical protein
LITYFRQLISAGRQRRHAAIDELRLSRHYCHFADATPFRCHYAIISLMIFHIQFRRLRHYFSYAFIFIISIA